MTFHDGFAVAVFGCGGVPADSGVTAVGVTRGRQLRTAMAIAM